MIAAWSQSAAWEGSSRAVGLVNGSATTQSTFLCSSCSAFKLRVGRRRRFVALVSSAATRSSHVPFEVRPDIEPPPFRVNREIENAPGKCQFARAAAHRCGLPGGELRMLRKRGPDFPISQLVRGRRPKNEWGRLNNAQGMAPGPSKMRSHAEPYRGASGAC